MIQSRTADRYSYLDLPWISWSVLILVIVSTAIFWLTDSDIRIMQFFFVPGGQQNWPIAKDQPWQFFYHAAPLLTLLPTLPALLVLMGSTRYPKLWVHRPVALFIVLCFALGPGLTVNMIFKDHWGRPRPRQVVELGGNQTYLPPLAPGEPGKDKSFPCGHTSVDFTYATAFFHFRIL